MSDAPMTIGALARQREVKVPTIRFYESIGLMPTPPRTTSGRRLYDESASRRLAFVKHARSLGFSIDAVRSLLDLADQPHGPCVEADRLAGELLESVERKITKLGALRVELGRMIAECQRSHVAECRVIEALSAESV